MFQNNRNAIIKFVKSLVVRIHLLIFKTPPGEFTKRLLKNLFFAFFGVGGATLITFGINILAVRYLGPTEFGKWNLIGSIAEFFIILPLWGLTTAALRYLGAERDKHKEIIGTSFRIVFLLSILFFPLYFILAPILYNFLKLDASLYNFAVVYAFILVFFYLFQSFFQGLEKFKQLSKLLIGSAFLFVIIVLFYLFVLKNYSFGTLLWGNIWRLALIPLVGLLIFRRFIFKFSYPLFKKLFHYGSFSMVSVFAGFFSLGMIDNLMINYYLGPEAVGLYSVYYIAFSVFVGRILNTFSQVFLPTASQTHNVKELFSRTLTAIKRVSIFIVGGLFILTWFLFQVYGENFTFDWRLALIISLSTTLYCSRSVFGNILASRGIKGIRFGPIFATANALLNVGLNFVFIPIYGIYGAAIATLLTVILTIWLPIYVLRRYFMNTTHL